jgi:hypothetical protein
MPIDPNVVVAAIGTGILPWIGRALWLAFSTGREVGNQLTPAEIRLLKQELESMHNEMRQLRESCRNDVQDIHEVISTNNDMQNDRYHDLAKDLKLWQLKIASKLGINGT